MVWKNSHFDRVADKKRFLVTPLFSFQLRKNGKTYLPVFFWEDYNLNFLIVKKTDKKGYDYSEIQNDEELEKVSKYWYEEFGFIPIFDKRTKKLSLFRQLKEFRYRRRDYGAYIEVVWDDSKVEISESITFFRIVRHKKTTKTVSIYDIKDNCEAWDLMFHYLDLKD